MTNDDNIKTVHELYGCARKNNGKQRLKFAKKLFIRRYNEGYSAVYIYPTADRMGEYSAHRRSY